MGSPLRPVVAGDFWQIAGNPDLGAYDNRPAQQPVDFSVWQAGDGTWQLWSCIRHTKAPGRTRLFYRWQGDRITDRDDGRNRDDRRLPGTTRRSPSANARARR